MNPYSPRGKVRPEAALQKKVITNLIMDGWFAKATHGNEFQQGFPDIFACHSSYGSKWIEMKTLTGRLRQSQRDTFLEFSKRNIGVWILTGATEYDMKKICGPPNWHTFVEIMRSTSNRASKIEEAKESRQQPDGPERRIQNAIKAELEKDGWFCKDTHGNIYQYGFPDLYCCHADWGARWIEVKNPTGYIFTPAQLKTFPMFQANGVGVWVLVDPSEKGKLFQPANWWTYLDCFK